MGPVTKSDGHDAPGLIDQLVPGPATVIDDVVVGFEDAVREPVVSHELPDILHRIDFGRFWRQSENGDVRGNNEVGGHMPASLIDQKHRMGSRRDGHSDFGQMQVHRFGIAGRQNQAAPLPC